MPAIAVHAFGIDTGAARPLSAAVRQRVVEALPEVAPNCSCRVLVCDAAELPEPAQPPSAWVEVTMFPGRQRADKRALYAAIIDSCAGAAIPPESVTIVVHEPPLENWGIRGGRLAADLFSTQH